MFLLMFPAAMSQVPGSHERVGLSSELPATERAHFEDKFKQMSVHKVQVNSRTTIPKFCSKNKKKGKKSLKYLLELLRCQTWSKAAMYAVLCGF